MSSSVSGLNDLIRGFFVSVLRIMEMAIKESKYAFTVTDAMHYYGLSVTILHEMIFAT